MVDIIQNWTTYTVDKAIKNGVEYPLWISQQQYDEVVATMGSVSKWAAIGYPDINYTAEHPWFSWNSYLCKIWNNIFMLGVYSRRYSSWNYDYFNSYLWIYYKLEWANSWSWSRTYLWETSSNVYTWATIEIADPVYISSDWSINMNITVKAWWTATVYNQYKKWTIGTNTVADSSQLTWEDLNNYKIYNSSISIWTIVPSDIYAVGYIIDDPLI